MKRITLLISTIFFAITSYAQQDTIIYAHRGFRGLMAENTIPAMINALSKGADVLEMDIAFSSDKEAIVSHDPWMDYNISLNKDGHEIAKGKGLPLYQMKYAEIKSYNVGSKQHQDFPKQKSFPAYIPRLVDLIDSVETYVKKNHLKKPWYSIETKTSVSRDVKFQPAPEEFVKRLMAIIVKKGIEDRVIIQSFDTRTLEIVNRDFPSVQTMININKGTLEENLARMTFKPDYYAPIPELIDAELIRKCKVLGIKMIGGNVNDKKEIDRLLQLGIDAYCTDYPYSELPEGSKIVSDISSAQEFHSLKIENTGQLKEFFRYKGKNTPIISGHRGGMIKGFPENSMETFENTLRYTPAFYEIDPRLTKDSVAVLMHDATLERTTNGTGKVADYTYSELQKLRLKDPEGHVTEAKIPTLKEAIRWSRGKTVLNLDKKDLPMEMTAKILTESKNSIIMVTVHNAEEAKFYYNYNPKWMLSAFVKTKKALKEYEVAGIPWSNMIAYIGSKSTPENQELLNLLHAKGVMCMISAAPSYDKLNEALEREKSYRMVFEQDADILESDFPIDVAKAIGN